MIWIQFLAGAALIVLAGTRLSRYAEQISERTGTKSALRIGAEALALAFVYLSGSYFLFVLSSR
jgi:Ca2+/Na+ antiporter